MALYAIVVTGFFYVFIALAMPVKKMYKLLYLIFGGSLVIVPFVVDVSRLKMVVLFLLYIPLIILGIFKSKIFK